MYTAAERTLEEIRQMLLRLRNVFSGGSKIFGAKTRSENMEELLKIWFGETRMNSKETPKYGLHTYIPVTLTILCRVMIFTVNKKTTDVQRHCFNNCFKDEYFSTGTVYSMIKMLVHRTDKFYTHK